eukprot:1158859-Pelagomonas_calceolata.AAC.5
MALVHVPRRVPLNIASAAHSQRQQKDGVNTCSKKGSSQHRLSCALTMINSTVPLSQPTCSTLWSE